MLLRSFFSAAPANADYLAKLAQLGQELVALQIPLSVQCDKLLPAACYAYPLPELGLRQLAHPGPYRVDLLLQPETPELVLRLAVVLDQFESNDAAQSPQARFALFLRSEEISELSSSELAARLQSCVSAQVAAGKLCLETCPSVQEWQDLRSKLEQLIFTRFGLSVENCLPVDWGAQCETAQILLSRQANDAKTSSAPAPATSLQCVANLPSSKQILRRLFLELPALCHAWRLLPWPADLAWYAQWQALAQRLDSLQSIFSAPPSHLLVNTTALSALHAGLEQAWALLASVQILSREELAWQSNVQLAAFAEICQQWEDAMQEPR